jgi:hypothetical protein
MSSGLAGSADIFNRGGASPEVMTPVGCSEDVREFALAKTWSLIASYRHAAPPERKLHFYGLALGYRF